MGNATTDHSKQLKLKTKAERNKAIKEDGGQELNVLLHKHDARRLKALCEWHGTPNQPRNQTEVVKRLIKEAFGRIPKQDLTEEQCNEAFGAGAVACSNGQKRGDNPHIEGTSLYHEWDNGWRQYDADYNPDYYSSPLADDL
jgi:hypothetical protein